LKRALSSLSLFLLLAGCAPSHRTDWPQWRGPGGLGISAGEGFPVVWSSDSPNIRWKAPLPGRGNSSPVVRDGRVFLTAAMTVPTDDPAGGQLRRMVLALDLDSGKLLWTRTVSTAPPEKHHRLNTVAAPTPVTDDESVYAYFGSVLARFDHDGGVLWKITLDTSYAEHSHYGAASSPVLSADAVVIVQDRELGAAAEAGWLAAFDRETGERLWRTEWRDTCCSYSTPLIVQRGGREEIVVALSGKVVGYAADTGEALWSHGYPIHQLVASPVLRDGLLVVAGGAHQVRDNIALRLSEDGAETSVEPLWEAVPLAPQTSSPLLYQNLMFTVTDQGVLTCRVPDTGEVLWKTRLPQRGNRSSLVAAEGRIYVHSSNGTTAVVAAAPEFHLLGHNDLGEPGSNASPALAAGHLLIRTEEHLVCIDGPEVRRDRG